jgi:hypothetical protein
MNMKGGVISFTTEKQDIMPELIRYANGDITFEKAGGFGVVFQMTSDVSTILSRNGCGLQSILIKLISIDKPLQFDKVDVKQVNEDDFEDEVHIHEEICKRSLTRFHCSITPTLLHAEVYTQEEFMRHFPKIGERITTEGRIGAIFMENMSDSETVFHLLQRDKRMVIETIFPKARRLLIMLAQLGFLHNDYKLDNLLSGDSLCIIDFGMATPITQLDVARLDTYLKEFDTEKIIEFLSVDTSHLNQIKYKGYIQELQWLRQDQVDTYDPVIDPNVKIAPEESIIDPIRLEEHSLCVVSKMKSKRVYVKQSNPSAYETLPEHLKRNMDVIRDALQYSGSMLSSVPEDLKTEPIVRIAVSNYGYSLKDVPERLKTKELVSIAVRNRGSSIQFAPEALKRDPELIHAAVTDESSAIKFIPEDMITKELLLLCVSKSGTSLRNIPKERIDHDIAIAAVKNNGDALKYVPERFRSEQVIRIAVSNPDDEDEDLFSYFPENLKENRPFLLQVLKINGHIVKFMDDPDGELLAYAKYSDIDNPVELTRHQNAKAIQFLKGKRKGDDEEFNEILDRFKIEFPSGGTRKRRRKRTRRFK